MKCVLLIAVFPVLVVLMSLLRNQRLRRLTAARVGETFDTFRGTLTADASDDVIEATYSVFQRWNSDAVIAFPVCADDDIANIYGMIDEDLDETVLEVIQTCERKLPSDPSIPLPAVVTVRDFVRFVMACRRLVEVGYAACDVPC